VSMSDDDDGGMLFENIPMIVDDGVPEDRVYLARFAGNVRVKAPAPEEGPSILGDLLHIMSASMAMDRANEAYFQRAAQPFHVDHVDHDSVIGSRCRGASCNACGRYKDPDAPDDLVGDAEWEPGLDKLSEKK